MFVARGAKPREGDEYQPLGQIIDYSDLSAEPSGRAQERHCGPCVTHTLHDAYSFIKTLQQRGRDAVGIAGIADDRIDAMKWIGTVETVDLVDLHKIMPSSGYHTVLAHVRYATKGSKQRLIEDAHPQGFTYLSAQGGGSAASVRTAEARGAAAASAAPAGRASAQGVVVARRTEVRGALDGDAAVAALAASAEVAASALRADLRTRRPGWAGAAGVGVAVAVVALFSAALCRQRFRRLILGLLDEAFAPSKTGAKRGVRRVVQGPREGFPLADGLLLRGA